MGKEDVKSASVTEQKIDANPNKIEALLLVILALLIGIPVLGYFMFVVNKTEVKTNPTKNEVVNEKSCETCDASECPKIVEQGCKVQDEEVSNAGWSVFKTPDIKVSVEVPNKVMDNTFGKTKLESYWSVTSADKEKKERATPDELGERINIVKADFKPFSIGDAICGGHGCANMSFVEVVAYKLNGRNLDDIWNKFVKDMTSDSSKITGEKTEKWGVSAYKYKIVSAGGQGEGYLLVKNDLLYKMGYDLSENPTEAFELAKKVLESVKIY